MTFYIESELFWIDSLTIAGLKYVPDVEVISPLKREQIV